MTWNCNMAFRKKIEFVKSYKPDILIVPECENLDKLNFNSEKGMPNGVFWYGNNPNKGLGVFSFSDFRVNLSKLHDERFKIILPLNVNNGRVEYSLFAIWANNPTDRGFQYIGQVWKALDYYRDMIGKEKTLLVGDFNSNSIWDRKGRISNHTDVVNLLKTKGIESVYHKYFEREHGKEAHPTLYMYRHLNKPYHIDYCFASSDMIQKLKEVEVGEYSKWISVSDHMPLVFDFH